MIIKYIKYFKKHQPSWPTTVINKAITLSVTLLHTAMLTPLTFAMKPTPLPALQCVSLTPATKGPRWPRRPLLPWDDPLKLKNAIRSSNPYSVVLPSKRWIDIREEYFLIDGLVLLFAFPTNLHLVRFIIQQSKVKKIYTPCEQKHISKFKLSFNIFNNISGWEIYEYPL